MNIYRLTLEFMDMFIKMQMLAYGATNAQNYKITNDQLNRSLAYRRSLSYELLGGKFRSTIGLSKGNTQQNNGASFVSFVTDELQPDSDMFIIRPSILKNYLPIPIINTMQMTHDDAYNATRRILFSFVFHEMRHQVYHRRKNALRNLDDAFRLDEFRFKQDEKYMRMIVSTRSALISLVYGNRFIPISQRLKMEEDAFVAEAIGFNLYPMWRFGDLIALRSKIIKYLLN